MTQMSPQARAERRARHGVFVPPEPERPFRAWHIVDTHLGRRRLQWRPGIDVWHGEDPGERWTAETAYDRRWVYVSVALDQTGGKP
jgi:hypothetical protein